MQFFKAKCRNVIFFGIHNRYTIVDGSIVSEVRWSGCDRSLTHPALEYEETLIKDGMCKEEN
jgi:hypothetical protein